MTIVLRPGTPADATACGTICYEAFKAVCTAHNFPPDFPSADVASGLLSMLLADPNVPALQTSDPSPSIRQCRTAESARD